MRSSKNKSTIIKKIKNKTFKKNDFYSGDGMLTTVWGPSMWHYLHTMSFNYPVNPTSQEKKQYSDFIYSLKYTLPCKYCRINLKNNFKKFPLENIIFENRNNFSRYIFNLHELINKMLKKNSGLTYCDVRDRYEHFRSRCTIEKDQIFKYSKFNKFNKFNEKKKEKGCIIPLYGKKSKCVISIVPQDKKVKTFSIDKKCLKHK